MPSNFSGTIPKLCELVTSQLSIVGGQSSNERIAIEINVVVLGAAKVGKTTIVEQFLYEKLSSDRYEPTVEQMYRTEYQLRNGHMTINLLDTSGSYEFPAMKQLAIQKGDAFILVYELENSDSFEEVRRLRDQIIEMKRPTTPTGGESDKKKKKAFAHNMTTPPIVVVGNKCDTGFGKRCLRREIVETVVNLDWENGYVECCAKSNYNVESIFHELLRQVRIPANVESVIFDEHTKPRRSSLPEHPVSRRDSINRTIVAKRHSCQIS